MISTITLVIAILVPAIMFVSFISFLIIWWFNTKVKIINNKFGRQIYHMDIQSRTYKMAKTKFNQKPYFRRDKFNSWKSMNDLSNSLLSSPESKRKFRAILQRLDAGSEEESMRIVYKHSKTKNVIFDFRYFKNYDSEYYIAEEKWRILSKYEKEEKEAYHPVAKQIIVDLNSAYKGFVAFNLDVWEINPEKKIVEISNIFMNKQKNTILKNSNYFISNGMLIYTFAGKDSKTIRNKINKFIKEFNKQKITMLGARFYKGSASAYTKNVTSTKTLNKMIATLDFLINRSIETAEDFVSHADMLKKEEFESFASSSNVFKNSIKLGKISFNAEPVRYWSTNKIITEYIKPSVDGINKLMLQKIVRNSNNRNLLMDEATNLIGVKKRLKKPVLVDVRADWLIENHDKLQYNKAIYVISYNQDKPTDDFRNIVLNLKKNKFIFALRIRKFNEDVSLLLESLSPDFLVISKNVRNKDELYDSATLISLMTIKKMCTIKKIKLIYEDPPTHIDNATSKKIGLKFFYK